MTTQVAVLHVFVGDVEVLVYRVPVNTWFADVVKMFQVGGGVWGGDELMTFYPWHMISRIVNTTEEVK